MLVLGSFGEFDASLSAMTFQFKTVVTFPRPSSHAARRILTPPKKNYIKVAGAAINSFHSSKPPFSGYWNHAMAPSYYIRIPIEPNRSYDKFVAVDKIDFL